MIDIYIKKERKEKKEKKRKKEEEITIKMNLCCR